MRLAGLAIGLYALMCASETVADTPPKVTVDANATVKQDAPIYRDESLGFNVRAHDLVKRMTLQEKAGQVGHIAPAIPRLGIPAYSWLNEGLHGVARAGFATVFPQAIGMAATWDTDRMRESASVISTEFRAKYLATLQPDGSSGLYQGLTVWSPNINIFRDPRWGRGQETYGEDPYLTGELGNAFITGLQGNDPKYYKTIATSKHFAIHSGPEQGRHQQDSRPTAKDLEETYLPAFRTTVVDGRVAAIMCSYNAIYGVAACANEFSLKQRLRKDWDFDGHVVTDCGAADNIYRGSVPASEIDRMNAIPSGFRAGMDLICGEYRNGRIMETEQTLEAVSAGALSIEILDQSVIRLLTARMRLGLFERPETLPWANITADDFDTPNHRTQSLEMARASMVLLKNDDGILPLKQVPKRIAVIGPNADSLDALIGNYYGTPSQPVTVLDGIRARFPDSKIEYAQGSTLTGKPEADVEKDVFCVDVDCLQRGLTAQHFDNLDLKGVASSTGVEDRPYVGWSGNQRHSSVRWTGYLTPPQHGIYAFRFATENGYRVFIDEKPVVDEWGVGDIPSILSGTVELVAGQTYAIRVEGWQRGQRGEQELVWTRPGDDGSQAVEIGKAADLIVFVGGLSARIEGEEMKIKADGFVGGDRSRISLPQPQEDLLKKLYATGKPVVLVLMNGSALEINWADKHIPAIVEAWYPGGSGGQAVAELLAGDYSPAGRLPITFYRSLDNLPAFTDYSMRNRTYRYHRDEVLYPFGHGLSYTSFSYSNPVTKQLTDGKFQVSVDVTNNGGMASDEVVQLYLSQVQTLDQPIRSLKRFKRIYIGMGQTITAHFTLDERALSTVDEQGIRKVVPGKVGVWIGGGQPITRPDMPMAPGVFASFEITKSVTLPK